MAFTMQDFHDLLRLLEAHPEWRADLRRYVLSDEFLELPAIVRGLAAAQARTDEQLGALAIKVGELAAAQQRTESRVEQLAQAQRDTSVQVRELAEQVARTSTQLDALIQAQTRTEQRLTDLAAEFRGDRLERRYRDHAAAYF